MSWTTAMPNSSVFKVPVAGLHESTMSTAVSPVVGYINVHLLKNGANQLTTAMGKPSFWTGGLMQVQVDMTPADSAFWNLFVNADCSTADSLLSYDSPTWCSIRMSEAKRADIIVWST